MHAKRELKCFCGEPAKHQWYVCADGVQRTICTKCDIALNGLVLDFMGDPEIIEKMKKYKEKMHSQEILEKSNAT